MAEVPPGNRPTMFVEFIGGPRDSEVLSNRVDNQAVFVQYVFNSTGRGAVGRRISGLSQLGIEMVRKSGKTPQIHLYEVAETERERNEILVRLKYVGVRRGELSPLE
jgi:hypothetical protein